VGTCTTERDGVKLTEIWVGIGQSSAAAASALLLLAEWLGPADLVEALMGLE